jgi:SAM-dependent methyltransferase
MTNPAPQISAADISRMAGVTRATVSNWRRRHADFPAPSGGTDTSPAYDLAAVHAWLTKRGALPADSPTEELRLALGTTPDRGGSLGLNLLPLVPELARPGGQELAHLGDLPDDELAQQAGVPAAPLRALLRCIREVGAKKAADVLVEHIGEDAPPGAYPTPKPLADLMAALLTDENGIVPAGVFDPACGSGTLLLAAAEAGITNVFGQDSTASHTVQTDVRLRVAAPSANVTVTTGDSLRDDAFPKLDADAALCNPPYGERDWGHDELAADPRWVYGAPPRSESELAWVQHCLAHLKPGGTGVVLMPPAVADRAAGRSVRSELVRSGALRAVVALPPGTAPPLHLGLHLWLLRAPEPSRSTAEPLLFVDAAVTDRELLGDVVISRWRRFLSAPEDFDTDPGLARSRLAIDLLDSTVDLTPARHVHTAAVTEEPAGFADRAEALRSRLQRSAGALRRLSSREWRPAGAKPATWRNATVADLVRGGALELIEPRPQARTTRGRTDTSPPRDIVIRLRDVIVPETLGSDRALAARIATERDEDTLLGARTALLRADPGRIDPWFLAGFLSAEDNVHAATTGSSVPRVDVRRLRVPLLPIEWQHEYARAFRELDTIRVAARITTNLAGETARHLATGLTSGSLLPPGSEPPTD